MRKRGAAAFMVFTVVAATSCGQKEDLGKDIGISVAPDTIEIVGGTGPSCVDKAQASSSGDAIQRSIGASRIQFSSFKLEWRGSNPLTVYDIEVRVENSALGDTYKTNLSSDEIEALLGRPGGVVEKSTGTNYTVIVSNDPSRTGGFVPCGLAVGGIDIPPAASSFTAKVTVIVKGYSENSETNEVTSIEQRTTAKAKYVKSF